jgi:hypothetical protein
MVDQTNFDPDYIDTDDPENYVDVGQMMENVIGNEPVDGEGFSIADEVSDDEEDH